MGMVPGRGDFTGSEWAVVGAHRTPARVQRYLSGLRYNREPSGPSLRTFREGGRWGAVARSRDVGLHGRRPVFRSLRHLAYSYFDPYVDSTARITGYGLASLYELGGYDWRFSRRNVWKVERHLQEIPHRPLPSSERRYRRLLARYKEFHARHPDRAPDYFDSRATWMR